MSWEIISFQNANGKYPVEEFICSQERQTSNKIARLISYLKEYGPFIKPPYMKKIEKDLFELRITGNVQIRIFYTFYQNKYYLLHAFKKKSQKTPKKEIKTALDRLKEII